MMLVVKLAAVAAVAAGKLAVKDVEHWLELSVGADTMCQYEQMVEYVLADSYWEVAVVGISA